MSREFRFVSPDGETVYLDEEGIDEWTLSNPEYLFDVLQLRPGDSIEGGGGAQPEWSLERLS